MSTSQKTAGTWLAAASLLMITALAFHGPIDPDVSVQMDRIADGALRWTVVHWIAAAGLSMFALVGLVVLTSGSAMTRDWWTFSAWAVLPVGALWTLATAVAEATVVANAAASGSAEAFVAWWAFAEGMANGFAVVALAVAAIALSDASQPDPDTPRWFARTAAVAGIGSFVGWAVGMWLGVFLGNILWLVSSIVMCTWTLWLGAAWVRVGSMRAESSMEYAS